LVKGEWDKGLPMLAKGSDAKLKELAQKELAGPKDAAEQAAVGDGWWDYAEIDKPGKRQLHARACYWYEQAVAGLPALAKAKVEGRLKEGAPAVKETAKTGWLMVFRSPDPKNWNTDMRNKLEFAMSLSKVPDDIQYLRLTCVNANDFVIIKMKKADLDKTTVLDNRFSWTASKNGGYVDLGVYDH